MAKVSVVNLLLMTSAHNSCPFSLKCGGDRVNFLDDHALAIYIPTSCKFFSLLLMNELHANIVLLINFPDYFDVARAGNSKCFRRNFSAEVTGVQAIVGIKRNWMPVAGV